MSKQFIDKSKITAAFNELAGLGYYTKQGLACCKTCAVAAVPNKFENNYVLYDGKGTASLAERGTCHLSWAGNGQFIVKTLEKHGLNPEWNGKKETRILIKLNNNMNNATDNDTGICNSLSEKEKAELVKNKIMKDMEGMMINAMKDQGEVPMNKRKKDNLGFIIPVDPEFEHQSPEYLIKRFTEQVEKAKGKFPNGFVAIFDFDKLSD